MQIHFNCLKTLAVKTVVVVGSPCRLIAKWGCIMRHWNRSCHVQSMMSSMSSWSAAWLRWSNDLSAYFFLLGCAEFLCLKQGTNNWYETQQSSPRIPCCHNGESNPLGFRGNYSTTSNNMKLVHWQFLGGLLHLVQRGGDWAEPQPNYSPPHYTKYKSPPINGQCTNHRIAV